jgi:hypothetical protein
VRAWRAPATLVEVIDASADFWGVICGRTKVQAFAKACDIAVQFRTDPWDDVLEEVRVRRSERGATMPRRATRRDARLVQMPTPEQAEQIREALGNPPSCFRPTRTREEALEGIRIYRDEHLSDAAPTRRHYLAACREDDRLVWPSALKDLTGKTFTELIAAEGM